MTVLYCTRTKTTYIIIPLYVKVAMGTIVKLENLILETQFVVNMSFIKKSENMFLFVLIKVFIHVCNM